MERKVAEALASWKQRQGRKPLLVLGCRQCGKTYSVSEFAREYYDDYVYMNLESDLPCRALFEGDTTAEALMGRIMMSFGKTYEPGKTLIVIDEIQVSPAALSSMKSFAAAGISDVIGTGSFLGTTLGNDSGRESPVGYVDITVMHPMDFEEFCWAMGVDRRILSEISDCIRDIRRADGYIDHVMDDLFRHYIAVGGMPEAVLSYAESRDYASVRRIQGNIMMLLKNDAGKYPAMRDRDKIIDCLESVPIQLSSGKDRFEYGSISK